MSATEITASKQSPNSIAHNSFTIERHFNATPAQVFAAWSDPQAKARWFVAPDDWISTRHAFDFRVGGSEIVISGPPGGTQHRFESRYSNIVTDQRIVYTYDMHMDDKPLSVSISSVEFYPESSGTRMVFTEQVAFLDGLDSVEERRQGTELLLDNLTWEVTHA